MKFNPDEWEYASGQQEFGGGKSPWLYKSWTLKGTPTDIKVVVAALEVPPGARAHMADQYSYHSSVRRGGKLHTCDYVGGLDEAVSCALDAYRTLVPTDRLTAWEREYLGKGGAQ